MDWWYWFGMWVAAVAGALLTWWVLIDSWRGRAVGTDLWPIAAMLGMAIQLPALALDEAARGAKPGTVFALAGVSGIVLVAVSAIAHFSHGQSAGRWLDRTSEPLERVSVAGTKGALSAERVLLGSPQPVKPEIPAGAEKKTPEPAYDGSATVLDADPAPTVLAEQSDMPGDSAPTVLSEMTISEDGATLLAEAEPIG